MNSRKWYRSKRNKKIEPKSNWLSYTKSDIINSTWDSIVQLDNQSLYRLALKASDLATKNRNKLLKYLMDNNLPVPTSLKSWHKKTSTLDTYSVKNAGIANLRSFIGKDYDMGYATIDFKVNSSMSRNELLHRIRVASDFLDNRASNVRGYRNYMKETVDRILSKTELKGKISFDDISTEQYKNIWRAYNRAISQKVVENYGGSETLIQEAFQYSLKNDIFDVEALTQFLQEKMSENYEQGFDDEDEDDYTLEF